MSLMNLEINPVLHPNLRVSKCQPLPPPAGSVLLPVSTQGEGKALPVSSGADRDTYFELFWERLTELKKIEWNAYASFLRELKTPLSQDPQPPQKIPRLSEVDMSRDQKLPSPHLPSGHPYQD